PARPEAWPGPGDRRKEEQPPRRARRSAGADRGQPDERLRRGRRDGGRGAGRTRGDGVGGRPVPATSPEAPGPPARSGRDHDSYGGAFPQPAVAWGSGRRDRLGLLEGADEPGRQGALALRGRLV